MLVISVSFEPIELCKLLKIANLVSGGGEAKMLIGDGQVLVNGEVEYQKRKKIYQTDTVEFDGEQINIVLSTTEQHNTTNPVQADSPPKRRTGGAISKRKAQPKLTSTNADQHRPSGSAQNPKESAKPKRKPIIF
jgi:ribosome-associated protein